MSVVQLIAENVREKLSASYRIGSFCQCVDELVYNSIDANSSAIAVRIDVDKFKIQVVDKGDGINFTDKQILGEKCCTSKVESGSSFGYKGEVLAAIVELSKECIVESTTSTSNETLRKQFLNGKVTAVKKSRNDRMCSGTTVTIKNLFHALPIRQKQHRCEFELEQVVQKITALAICHSHISFSLRNECNAKILIQTRRTVNSADTFKALFYTSYPYDLVISAKQNFKHSDYMAELFLGPKPFRNSSLQFVFVNGRPVFKTRLHRIVHELISNFLKSTCDWVFILKVTCSRTAVEVFDSDGGDTFIHFKNWKDVEEMLSELIQKCSLSNYENIQDEENSSPVKLAIKCPYDQREGALNHSDVVRSKVVKNNKIQTEKALILPTEIAESLEDENVSDANCSAMNALEVQTSTNFVNDYIQLPRIQPQYDFTNKYKNVENSVEFLGIWSNVNDEHVEEMQTVSQVSLVDNISPKVNGLRISKDMLPFVRVINQVDNKFIVCSLKIESVEQAPVNLLLIFDQHAVSERICLENLLTEHCLNTTVARTILKDPVLLHMDTNEIRFAHSFHDKFETFGISILEQKDGSSLLVASVPRCLSMKETNDMKNLRCSRLNQDLMALISQINEALRTTKGVLVKSWIPKCLRDIMNTIACRSAIKFGEILIHEECEKLLENLSKCQNPFECAHGRPSVAPIADITRFINL